MVFLAMQSPTGNRNTSCQTADGTDGTDSQRDGVAASKNPTAGQRRRVVSFRGCCKLVVAGAPAQHDVQNKPSYEGKGWKVI
jgi:hypothetical protein